MQQQLAVAHVVQPALKVGCSDIFDEQTACSSEPTSKLDSCHKTTEDFRVVQPNNIKDYDILAGRASGSTGRATASFY